MISIVCVYNNKEILENFLLKSLKLQNTDYQLILLDNTENKFKSAAEALNYGGEKAKGKYIMFVHQDIDLCSENFLEETEKILDTIQSLGVAGVAGMSEKGKDYKNRCRNIIKNGVPPKVQMWGRKIEKPEKVQTLDELLVIIPKHVFEKLKFDAEICDDWHLYAVDYCLSVKEIGLDSWVIPMFVYHRSIGFSFSEKKYYLTLEKVLKKHKKKYRMIYTTFRSWSTLYPISIQLGIWHLRGLLKATTKILLKKLGIMKK